MKRRYSAAQRANGRLSQAIARNKAAATKAGRRLTHGLVDTFDRAGCRCPSCRCAKAASTGRPVDPHYPTQHVELHDTG